MALSDGTLSLGHCWEEEDYYWCVAMTGEESHDEICVLPQYKEAVKSCKTHSKINSGHKASALDNQGRSQQVMTQAF